MASEQKTRRIYVVANNKGGVGKTTTAANVPMVVTQAHWRHGRLLTYRWLISTGMPLIPLGLRSQVYDQCQS